MGVFRRYREVLSPPGAASALSASVLGRLALGMTGLAVLLLVRKATGSYADAGFVSAAYAVSFALAAPYRARAADRRGPTSVLRMTGLCQPVAFGLLVVLADVGAATPFMAASAVLIGFTVPPLGSVMRALWGQLVQGRQLATAYSLESVVVELCFVLGPLLVGALALIEPELGVLACGVVAGVGALGLAANPRVRAVVPHEERSTNLLGPLVSPVVRACLLNVLWIGTGFGTIEVGVLAFVDEQGHSRSTAGVVLAVWSLGSILGGLVYGGLHLSSAASRQLPLLVTVNGLAAALPVLAPDVVLLGGLLLLAGSTIAPFSACNSVLIGSSAPAGTVTEAFAWNGSMIFGGAAMGTAIAGVLVDAYGAEAAFLATVATGVLTIGSSALGLRALRLVRVPEPAWGAR
jgi:MFS family permease